MSLLDNAGQIANKYPTDQQVRALGIWQWEKWLAQARPEQVPPPGDWRVWYLMGGRGSGKTRAGAETLAHWEHQHPGWYAAVAPTFADAKDVCAEDPESGLIAVLGNRVDTYNRSLGEIFLKSGSRISLDGADDGALRIQGRNLSGVWCLVPSACIMTSDGTKEIQDVGVGDLVATREGWRKVTAAARTRIDAPVIAIRLSNDRTLRCTPDHPVWVIDRGWTDAGCLKPGDSLYSAPPLGSSIGGDASTGSTPVTTSQETSNDHGGFIKQSGNTNTDARSPTDRSFITSMVTGPTTTRKTFAPCPEGNTTPPMREHVATQPRERESDKGSSNPGIVALSEQRRAPAAEAATRLDQVGTAPTVPSVVEAQPCAANATDWLSGHPHPLRANDAAHTSFQRTGVRGSAQASAARPVSVIAVVPDGTSDVYDLTVEDVHEFFAEGVLVKNCDEVGLWHPSQWDRAWKVSVRLAVRKDPALIVATGTPKMGHPLVALLVNDNRIPVSRLRTSDNVANLTEAALEAFYEEYAGTVLGKQELDGEWIMALEGDLLKRAWWKYYPARRNTESDTGFVKRLPRFQMVLVSVDTPLKDKESGDFVAIQVWGVDKANRYLLDARTERMGYDAAKRAVTEMSKWARRMWNTQHRTLIENAGFGVEMIIDLKRELGMVEKISVGAEGNKGQRAFSAASDLETGQCYLPGRIKDDLSGPDETSPAITHSLVEEAALFQMDGSHHSHDDQVDAWSQAMNWLRSRQSRRARTWSSFKQRA